MQRLEKILGTGGRPSFKSTFQQNITKPYIYFGIVEKANTFVLNINIKKLIKHTHK